MAKNKSLDKARKTSDKRFPETTAPKSVQNSKKFPGTGSAKSQPMYSGKASKTDPVTTSRGYLGGVVNKRGSVFPDAKGGSGRRMSKSP